MRKTLAILTGLLWLAPLSVLAVDMPAAGSNADVAERVATVFADAPTMIAVAKCESGLRQYGPDGLPLHGGGGGHYVGIFQISEQVHRAFALSLGMDIDTVEGNIAYARRLYDASGSQPWAQCVPKSTVTPPAPASSAAIPSVQFTVNLNIGMTHQQVRDIQRTMNVLGFTVATIGIGSSGHETSYFGSLTRDAIRRFQCAKQLACEGNESTTGYGRVGPKTRAALQEALTALAAAR